MLDCCAPLDVVREKGITLDTVGVLCFVSASGGNRVFKSVCGGKPTALGFSRVRCVGLLFDRHKLLLRLEQT